VMSLPEQARWDKTWLCDGRKPRHPRGGPEAHRAGCSRLSADEFDEDVATGR